MGFESGTIANFETPSFEDAMMIDMIRSMRKDRQDMLHVEAK